MRFGTIGTWTGRPWRGAALLAAGALGGGAAMAVATVPDSGGVIHACVQTSGGHPVTISGNVRIIDPGAGQACNTVAGVAGPPEQSLSWNVTGPQGATGPTGATGKPGTATYTIVPPVVKASARPDGGVTLGSGRGALHFNILSFGVAIPRTGGAHGGNVDVHDITITKNQDSASVKLFQAVVKGKHFPKASIVLKKTKGDKTTTYLTYKLQDVIVSSVQTSSARGNGKNPLETVTLNFTKVAIESAK